MSGRLTFIVLVILASVLLAACGAKRQTPSNLEAMKAEREDMREYYPLAVGNEWTFEGVFIGKKEKRTIKILKEEEGVFIDDAGGRLRFDARGLRDDKRYLIRLPIHETNEWMSIPSPVVVERYRYDRVRFAERVKAGDFSDCIRVVSTITMDETKTMTNVVTYAKGVGIIKISTTMHDGTKKIPQANLELIDYKIQGGSAKSGAADEEAEEQVLAE